jgi:hypothetical protein
MGLRRPTRYSRNFKSRFANLTIIVCRLISYRHIFMLHL